MRSATPWTMLLLLLPACVGAPRRAATMPDVPVSGSARDLRWLAGDWAGEFVSSRHDREGRVALTLQGARDTAQGRVVFSGPAPPPGCTDPVSAATGSHAEGTIQLSFARIEVTGRSVAGWMRPYRDPELGCLMDAWFEGEVRGDTIAGMYFVHPADSAAPVRLGTWWVARQR